MASQPDLFPPGAAPPLAEAELDALVRWLAPLRSRRAMWAALHEHHAAGLGLSAFYRMAREQSLERALSAACAAHPEAARALLRLPAPKPPVRVSVSTLAQQFYCDLQVHLGTLHEVKVSSRELAAGTAGHAVLESAAEPLTDDEVARRIGAGEAMGLVEVPLAARLEGVDVFGRADRVQLRGRDAEVVLEFKFSSRADLFPSHVAQVQSYGLLLGASGLSTTRLVHAVAVIARRERGGPRPELAEELAQRASELAAAAWPAPVAALEGATAATASTDARAPAVHDPLEGLGARVHAAEGYTLHVFRHDEAAAVRTVRWALAYWKGERAPEPTRVAGKCRACPYNAAGLCGEARAAHDGRYAVHSQPRPGRRTLHLLSPAR